jgi:hypothetical protein
MTEYFPRLPMGWNDSYGLLVGHATAFQRLWRLIGVSMDAPNLGLFTDPAHLVER